LGVVIVLVPAPFKTIVWFGPALTVYVTVAFEVPLKVITVLVPEQIVAVPEIVAVGNGFTVTIALPDCVWLQTGNPEDVTLTKA
jgi:hypothetical protein